MCCNKYFLLERILGLEHVWKYVKQSLHLLISSLPHIYNLVSQLEKPQLNCIIDTALCGSCLMRCDWLWRLLGNISKANIDCYQIQTLIWWRSDWWEEMRDISLFSIRALPVSNKWDELRPNHKYRNLSRLGNHYSSYFGRSCLCSEPITIC